MRLRPSVVRGVDPAARSIARRLAEALKPEAEAGLLHVFEPEAEPAGEFARFVARVRESLRARDVTGEPGLVVLACAFAEEAARIGALLRASSEALETVLPGAQSITLVVFLPPAMAPAEEEIRTFDFFVQLEAVAGELPYLDLIFVNQLPEALYRGAESADAAGDAVYEVLLGQLADPELEGTTRSTGYQAVRAGVQVSGRKCCYSTAGRFELVYLPGEALAYLKARFGWDLWRRGLLDMDSVSEEETGAIRERAAAFLSRQGKLWSERLPVPGRVEARALAEPMDPDRAAGPVAEFEREAALALARNSAGFEQALASGESAVREEFGAFLTAGPKYLAGATVYAGALEGPALEQLEKEFCRAPLVRSIEEALAPRLAGLYSAAGAGLPPRREDEQTAFAWLAASLGARGSFLEASEPGEASPLRVCASLFDCLLEYASRECDPPAAAGLVRETVSLFLEESGALFGARQRNGEERAQVETELRALPARYGWFKRTFRKRGEYLEERAGFEETIAELDRERAALEEGFRGAHEIFAAVANQVVLPNIPRARVYGCLRDEARAVAKEFAEFLAGIGQPLEAYWAKAAAFTQSRTATGETILSGPRLDKLYERLLEGRGMPAWVERVLAFRGGGKESYRNCRDLRDHFFAGPAPLLERIGDHSDVLLEAFRRLDALDIIEVLGREEAARYLAGRVEKAKTFLDFAPGLAPNVDARQAMSTTFVVRSAAAINSRLAERYWPLFQPAKLFLDTQDSNRIRIDCLIFGFPAFLIQRLAEPRRLAMAQPGRSGDLWPRPRPDETRAAEAP